MRLFFLLATMLLGGLSINVPKHNLEVLKYNYNTSIVLQDEPETKHYATLVIEGSDFGNVSLKQNGNDLEKGTDGRYEIINADLIIIAEPKEEHKFYSGFVKVNGVDLKIENNQYVYKFGEKFEDISIEAKFIIDFNKIWNYFTSSQFWNVNLIFSVVTWLFNSGILIVIVRYFLKDKKLVEKLEKQTDKTIKEIMPELVQKTFEDVIAPAFEKNQELMIKIQMDISTLAECMALAQEDTPEARLAIIEALKKVTITDTQLLSVVKKQIEELTENAKKEIEDAIKKLDEVKKENEEIVKETDKVVEEEQKIESAD